MSVAAICINAALICGVLTMVPQTNSDRWTPLAFVLFLLGTLSLAVL